MADYSGRSGTHRVKQAIRGRTRIPKEGGKMSASKKPLRPEDFPVNAEGRKIKKQDGRPIADAEDPAVAEEVAETP